jgi:glycosyltransferase involved in cell wall biosynthesis
MKVLVVGPNAGVSLSTGGGSRTAFEMAWVFRHEFGADVTLAAYHTLSAEVIRSIHDIDLRGIPILDGGADEAYEKFRATRFQFSPYLILGSRKFRQWVRSAIASADPEVVWFHDDIPAGLADLLTGRRVYLYVHFPFAGRSTSYVAPIHQSETRFERLSVAVIRAMGSRWIEPDPRRLCTAIVANASITANVIAQAWGKPPRVVFPPVSRRRRPGEPAGPEPGNILAIGAFKPSKGFHTIIEAVRRSTGAGLHLHLAGTARDSRYLRAIRTQIDSAGIAGSVTLHTEAPGADIHQLLCRASVIVNAAIFEPFGVSLVEGMGFGATPIALRTNWNGGWIDVLDRGRYGDGFSGPEDLAARLRDLSSSWSAGSAARQIERADRFGRDAFTSGLRDVMRG